MRQLVFHGPRRLAVEEAAEPRPAPGELLVAVHSVGVCGSDVDGFTGANGRRTPGMVMGHEAVGRVAALGEGVEGPPVGTPVAVNPVVGCGECDSCAQGEANLCRRRGLYGCVPWLPGAFADYLACRARNAVPWEGAGPLEWGALVEPLSVGFHAGLVGGVGAGSEVLVLGGGPIGFGAALGARRLGARRVVVSEPVAHRRELAERLGLETLDPSAGGEPRAEFDLAIECVAYPETIAAALGAVPAKGRVVLVGLAEEVVPVPLTPFVTLEKALVGSSAYTDADFRSTARWIASSGVDLSPLIEARVDLDGLPAVFEGYADGSLQALKTLLQTRSD